MLKIPFTVHMDWTTKLFTINFITLKVYFSDAKPLIIALTWPLMLIGGLFFAIQSIAFGLTYFICNLDDYSFGFLLEIPLRFISLPAYLLNFIAFILAYIFLLPIQHSIESEIKTEVDNYCFGLVIYRLCLKMRDTNNLIEQNKFDEALAINTEALDTFNERPNDCEDLIRQANENIAKINSKKEEYKLKKETIENTEDLNDINGPNP